MTALRRHRQRSLALALVRRRLRTVPIHLLTGISELEIRGMYRAIHGTSPSSGLIPTAAGLFSTRYNQAQCSLFAGLYRRLGGPAIHRQVEAEALIQAYDLFRQLLLSSFGPGTAAWLDLTGAWVLARDLRTGTAWLRACPNCRARYLVAEGSGQPPTCPYCALRDEWKRKRAASPP